jgi:hypothetical protein
MKGSAIDTAAALLIHCPRRRSRGHRFGVYEGVGAGSILGERGEARLETFGGGRHRMALGMSGKSVPCQAHPERRRFRT